VADFDQLVEMLNFAVAIAMLLEFAAFIKLRITDDDGKLSLAEYGFVSMDRHVLIFCFSRLLS
jgi:hypothetical protein